MQLLSSGFDHFIEKNEISESVKKQFSNVVVSEMIFAQLIIGIYVLFETKKHWLVDVLVVTICVIKAVFQIECISEIRNNMIYFGYSITLSSIKSRNVIRVIMLLQIITITICALILYRREDSRKMTAHKNEKYVEANALNAAEESAIRQKLIDMGMDKDIAANLLEDEIVKLEYTKKLSHTSHKVYLKSAEANVEIHCYLAEIGHKGNCTKARVLYYVKWDENMKSDGYERFADDWSQSGYNYFEKLNEQDFVGICDSGNEKKYCKGEIKMNSYISMFGEYIYGYNVKRYFNKGENEYQSYLGQDYYFFKDTNNFILQYEFNPGNMQQSNWIKVSMQYDINTTDGEMTLTSDVYYNHMED